ncbi:hypothetical protein BTR14_10590 [Rhizobium rhizosphaerae]|uniref:Uncharacterized protein n=2 Tax=Xaviernesmea rhizosphaerae TaxID=1672749 RepID=A0ABX3PE39_9HYPH|nr:hypothetical protein BTR14_10590 [Xaviernesmea rhizosphaerae]
MGRCSRTLAPPSVMPHTPPRAAIARIKKDNAIARLPDGALLVRSFTNIDLPETLRRFGQRAIESLEAVTV